MDDLSAIWQASRNMGKKRAEAVRAGTVEAQGGFAASAMAMFKGDGGDKDEGVAVDNDGVVSWPCLVVHLSM